MMSSRLPRNGSSESRSGIQGASPSTHSTDASSAAEIATAPPIEKPSSSVRRAASACTAARESSSRPRRDARPASLLELADDILERPAPAAEERDHLDPAANRLSARTSAAALPRSPDPTPPAFAKSGRYATVGSVATATSISRR
jgi:hypothetical protein